jgi:acetylornithine deacetylase/succinyl-diaminopimelate desuccinylase-like protein
VVEGFGLGVARGPAAAALLGFVHAGRGTLLLAGSGTHRSGGRAAGVEHYLANHPAPEAAIVAKCGPATVLWEEPGAEYLHLRVTGRFGAALAPESATPPGGIIAHAGIVLDAANTWREEYLRQCTPVGQLGAEAGIGAVRAGAPDKPDLLPAALELDLYIVFPSELDECAIADQLRAWVLARCVNTPLAECDVDVTTEMIHQPARTSAGAPIVRSACRAWESEFGQPAAPIERWTGSTDGVVFRAHGIDTVRLGPQNTRSADDPRRDRIEISQLNSFASVYAAVQLNR